MSIREKLWENSQRMWEYCYNETMSIRENCEKTHNITRSVARCTNLYFFVSCEKNCEKTHNITRSVVRFANLYFFINCEKNCEKTHTIVRSVMRCNNLCFFTSYEKIVRKMWEFSAKPAIPLPGMPGIPGIPVPVNWHGTWLNNKYTTCNTIYTRLLIQST